VANQYAEMAVIESDELTDDDSDEIHAAWYWVANNNTRFRACVQGKTPLGVIPIEHPALLGLDM
jgi:hypothetical protein